jgi:hypothetical protein
MTATRPLDRLAEAASAHDDATLIGALGILDARIRSHVDAGTPVPQEERMVYAATCGVLEARYPAVDDYMNAWVDELDDGRTYAQALVAAIAEVTA